MKYLAFLLLIPLAACASLSEDECRAGDWLAIGQKDGARGRTPDFIQSHAEACAEYGVRPNRALWEKGRQGGLPLYCRPAQAWEEGAQGRLLRPVCPPEDLRSLERAHRRGLTYRHIGQELGEIERDIRQINSELADLAADDPLRARLISERSRLRLRALRLRADRMHYRY